MPRSAEGAGRTVDGRNCKRGWMDQEGAETTVDRADRTVDEPGSVEGAGKTVYGWTRHWLEQMGSKKLQA